jgi:hypothetical protein
VRRTPFSLIACWHGTTSKPGCKFHAFFLCSVRCHGRTKLRQESGQLALRNIGKRNPHLNQAAIQFAEELQKLDSKSARWIAATPCANSP